MVALYTDCKQIKDCVDVGRVAEIYVERLMGLNASSESEGAADHLSHWLVVHLQTMIVLQSLLVTQKSSKRKNQRLQMKSQRKMKTRIAERVITVLMVTYFPMKMKRLLRSIRAMFSDATIYLVSDYYMMFQSVIFYNNLY